MYLRMKRTHCISSFSCLRCVLLKSSMQCGGLHLSWLGVALQTTLANGLWQWLLSLFWIVLVLVLVCYFSTLLIKLLENIASASTFNDPTCFSRTFLIFFERTFPFAITCSLIHLVVWVKFSLFAAHIAPAALTSLILQLAFCFIIVLSIT